jgi:carbamoyl-phosphate synthase large subunit
MPQSAIALSVEEAERIADDLGYPVVIRPAYTMGGWGGGLVYNLEELRTIAARGIGEIRRGRSQVRSLQSYHAGIK